MIYNSGFFYCVAEVDDIFYGEEVEKVELLGGCENEEIKQPQES